MNQPVSREYQTGAGAEWFVAMLGFKIYSVKGLVDKCLGQMSSQGRIQNF